MIEMEPLKPNNSYKRTFERYGLENVALAVYDYMFNGTTTRDLQERYFNDREKNTGFQAMEVLHYIGLTGSHQNCYSNKTISVAIEECEKLGYTLLKELLIMISDGNRAPFSINDGLTTIIVSADGKQTNYYTTRYERKKANRDAAIRIHGTSCMACGFNFEKTYGSFAKDFIEVHHVVPLSSIKQEVLINPNTDLICLCSNCHKMIHKKEVLSG